MYIYISFYKEFNDKTRRKAIHVVDAPMQMFRILNENVKETLYTFYAYQVNVPATELYMLYRDFYDSDTPPFIKDSVMQCGNRSYLLIDQLG